MCSQLRHIQPQPDDPCDNTRRETVKALGCKDEAMYVVILGEVSYHRILQSKCILVLDPGLPVSSIFPFTKMHVRNNLITPVAQ